MTIKKEAKSGKHSILEKLFAPFAFLTGNPTKPSAVPFLATAPKGLALVFSASIPAEADWIRQVLRNAGFHVEYVPPVTTGVFGTSGSAHVYVRADQNQDAREFISQFLETAGENRNKEDEME